MPNPFADLVTGTITPTEPTWREKSAGWFQDLLERAGTNRYRARKISETLLGGPSSNLPLNMGLADPTPLGSLFGRQENPTLGPSAPGGLTSAIFAGVTAETAPLKELDKAKALAASGIDPKAVWKETGWFKGGDGKWRWEIDDSKSMFRGFGGVDSRPVGQTVHHPAAMKAYPEMADMRTQSVAGKGGSFSGEMGYAPSSPTVNLGFDNGTGTHSVALHELQHAIQQREGFARGGSPSEIGAARDPIWEGIINKRLQPIFSADDALRESQRQARAILMAHRNAIEGYPGYAKAAAKGDTKTMQKAVDAAGVKVNVKDYLGFSARRDALLNQAHETKRRAEFGPDQVERMDIYKRLAGEAEARAVQARMNMTPEQRRATFPLDSYDVPASSLIYRMEGTGPQMATVYHGSPHKFDAEKLVRLPDGREVYVGGRLNAIKEPPPGSTLIEDFPLGRFRPDAIGTGEGAQAFGYGHYQADAPATASSYKKAGLHGMSDDVLDPAKISDAVYEAIGPLVGDKVPFGPLQSLKTRDELRQMFNADPWGSLEKLPVGIRNKVAQLLEPPPGNLYKVDLPDPVIARMLDWDKPLSQQAPEVQKTAAAIFAKMDPDARKLVGNSLGDLKGKKLYELMASDDSVAGAGTFGAAASDTMRKAGIPGIRYLDSGSRGFGTGTSNYVVFPGEETALKILERNGIPVSPETAQKLGGGGKITQSRNDVGIYAPKPTTPRPFDADYPQGAGGAPGSPLAVDMDGRPLGAPFIAGRRVVGGPDQGLSASDANSIAELLGIKRVPAARSSPDLKGDAGRYTSGGGLRQIAIDKDLPADKAGMVLSHELGHGLDDLAMGQVGPGGSRIPTKGLSKELGALYEQLNTGGWFKPGRGATPASHGYAANRTDAELMAEAIRAYMQDPNYIKTVAPKVAARIREHLNANPNVNKAVQFNAPVGTAIGAGLLGSGYLMADKE